MDNETVLLYETRIANCVHTAKQPPKDSWAYNFWMQTANKIAKKLNRTRL
jgi:transcription initiation factor IIE alpha subunit